MTPTVFARKIKVPVPLLHQLTERATRDGTTPAAVIRGFIDRYATGELATPQLAVAFPAGAAAIPQPESMEYLQQRKTPTRMVSLNVSSDLWSNAMDRAAADGLTLSAVINRFLRGYVHGLVNPTTN